MLAVFGIGTTELLILAVIGGGCFLTVSIVIAVIVTAVSKNRRRD